MSTLTNYQKWLSYTETLSSPDNYIQWAWLFLISAALQRRVWVGPDHLRRYPNMYVILVGEPGLGKSIVIKPVTNILKYHKLADPATVKLDGKLDPKDKEIMKESLLNDYKMAQDVAEGKEVKGKLRDKPLLFPSGPDDTTYEALAETMAQSIRRINYEKWDDEAKANIVGIYTHSSMFFSLEELSSLIKQHTENTVKFLMVTYDCGDYTKKTKTSGIDRIRACCLSILGGTTPGYMQETFDDKLLNEGLSSRTFFIYAEKNRRKYFFPPDLTEEQNNYYNDILLHVKKLSTLYGRVNISEDTCKFMQEWADKSDSIRVNMSPRLNSYYARKDNHLAKVAMALHFSESLDMTIPTERFAEAMELLEREEKNMHMALGVDNSNPLAVPMKKIQNFIYKSENGVTKKQIIMEYWSACPGGTEDIEKILSYLEELRKIKVEEGEQINGVKRPLVYKKYEQL